MSAAALAREALTVPETLAADDLLAAHAPARRARSLVIDEYGGTAGLVTFESLMERIVGELRRSGARARCRIHDDGSADIDGLTLVTDVNEQFGLHIDEDTYTTIGGYVLGRIGRRRARRRHDRGRRAAACASSALDGLRVAKVWLSTPRTSDRAELRADAPKRDAGGLIRAGTPVRQSVRAQQSQRVRDDDHRRAGVGEDRHPQRRHAGDRRDDERRLQHQRDRRGSP